MLIVLQLPQSLKAIIIFSSSEFEMKYEDYQLFSETHHWDFQHEIAPRKLWHREDVAVSDWEIEYGWASPKLPFSDTPDLRRKWQGYGLGSITDN